MPLSTYNEHGELVTTGDARGILTLHTVDALDRVTAISHSDGTPGVTYVFDTRAFGKGRLTSITRSGQAISYVYDRFGRVLQDGALSYFYDRNGNRTRVTYPNSVAAVYTFDFADREISLTYEQAGVPQAPPIVTAATYKPFGPLASLTFGNSLTETRLFDARYFPDRIQVPGRLDWDYTDSVGNILQIADLITPSQSRTYAYRDFQYFLTLGNGPWGTRSWTYNRIGSRLTETRGAVTDTYTYSGGNPKLQTIVLGGGASTRYFFYDAAGNQAQDSKPTSEQGFSYDAGGRLTRLEEVATDSTTTVSYDGRGFLRESRSDLSSCFPIKTQATYSSEGQLFHRVQRSALPPEATTLSEAYVFYFAGRPVAILEGNLPSPLTRKYLTTDHLGTPALATNAAGATTWSGGFEPFGADWNGAQAAGVFPRFPGQWSDASWDNAELDTDLLQNVYRWYMPATGKYDRPDPEWLESIGDYSGAPNQLFGYAESQPLTRADPLGLLSFHLGNSCRRLPPDRLSRLQQAVADAQGSLGRVTACKQMVASEENITIRCGQSCGGGCARYKPSIVIAGPSICVSPLAFGGTNAEGQGCGIGDTCLASTIFHEMVHACGGVHPSRPGRTNPYACEQKLYPLCRQQFPQDTGECPCTIE